MSQSYVIRLSDLFKETTAENTDDMAQKTIQTQTQTQTQTSPEVMGFKKNDALFVTGTCW